MNDYSYQVCNKKLGFSIDRVVKKHTIKIKRKIHIKGKRISLGISDNIF